MSDWDEVETRKGVLIGWKPFHAWTKEDFVLAGMDPSPLLLEDEGFREWLKGLRADRAEDSEEGDENTETDPSFPWLRRPNSTGMRRLHAYRHATGWDIAPRRRKTLEATVDPGPLRTIGRWLSRLFRKRSDPTRNL